MHLKKWGRSSRGVISECCDKNMNHSFSPLLPTTGENEEQQKLTVNMKDPPSDLLTCGTSPFFSFLSHCGEKISTLFQCVHIARKPLCFQSNINLKRQSIRFNSGGLCQGLLGVSHCKSLIVMFSFKFTEGSKIFVLNSKQSLLYSAV